LTVIGGVIVSPGYYVFAGEPRFPVAQGGDRTAHRVPPDPPVFVHAQPLVVRRGDAPAGARAARGGRRRGMARPVKVG